MTQYNMKLSYCIKSQLTLCCAIIASYWKTFALINYFLLFSKFTRLSQFNSYQQKFLSYHIAYKFINVFETSQLLTLTLRNQIYALVVKTNHSVPFRTISISFIIICPVIVSHLGSHSRLHWKSNNISLTLVCVNPIQLLYTRWTTLGYYICT